MVILYVTKYTKRISRNYRYKYIFVLYKNKIIRLYHKVRSS